VKRTALHRKSRLRRKRLTERRSSRVRDEAYLAWVRMQPCAVAAYHCGVMLVGCSGSIDPDHQREGVGMGQKASDRQAWPCCRAHHDQRHDLTGVFRGWTREQLREFIANRIAEANAAYERHRAGDGKSMAEIEDGADDYDRRCKL
jgi:hypothetical protein